MREENEEAQDVLEIQISTVRKRKKHHQWNLHQIKWMLWPYLRTDWQASMATVEHGRRGGRWAGWLVAQGMQRWFKFREYVAENRFP